MCLQPMFEDGELKPARIHRALSRPTLLFGADRELVLVTGLASAILIFVILKPMAAVLGIGLWIIVVGILRMMAKSDPQMRDVYLRHIKYRAFYRPTSSPWRKY
jgi:type IV secretion system protein TrbD